jgi:hypothetical protein
MPARAASDRQLRYVVWVQAITAVSLRASKQDAAIFNENFT